MSVSTLISGSGAATPVSVVKGCIGLRGARFSSRGRARRRGARSTAAAAAIAGLTRCVRPPRPWRPSKLRFEVDGAALAGRQLVGVHRRGTSSSRARAIRSRPRGRCGRGPPASAWLLHQAGARHDHRAHAVGDLAAPGDRGRGAQILDAAVGAGADEDAVDLQILQPRCRRSGPCSRACAPSRGACPRRARSAGSGTMPVIGSDVLRAGAPGDCGAIFGGVEHDLLVEMRAVVGRQRLPAGDGLLPGRALGRHAAGPSTIVEGRLVRRDQAGARARLDRHVADRHAAFHASARIASPAYSMTWPVPPAVPILPMIARIDVLGGDAERQRAVDA